MDIATYRRLISQARRLSRSTADAEDLVQDVLLAALQAGRDDPAWLYGVLRKQAALQARGAVRRRRREQTSTGAPPVPAPDEVFAAAPQPLARRHLMDGLPPAARRVAVLALHGLNADEIRWLLDLPATAFRQRLSSIRRALGAKARHSEQLVQAYLRDPMRSADLEFGLVRRALKTAMRAGEGLGAHDHDGHLLVIRGQPRPPHAHTSPRGGNE